MKKVFVVGFVLLLFVLLLPGAAMAGDDGKGDNDQPYWGMIGEDNCIVPNGGYSNDWRWWERGDRYWAFYTANHTFIGKCVGHLDDGVDPPDSKVHLSGFWCRWPGLGWTTATHAQIHPNGTISMTCKYSP